MQPSLFDAPSMVRYDDPRTSHEAAASLGEVTLNKAQQAAFEVVRARAGATADDVATATGMQRGCASKRLGELELKGRVRVLCEVRNVRGRSVQLYVVAS